MQLVERKNIDIKKYNACIANSFSPKIYAYSWWLDIVSPNWKTLVWNDYSSVMPVPIKKVWFTKKIIQPIFTQQLGVFSSDVDLFEKCQEGLNYLHNNFKSGYLQLNDNNTGFQNEGISNRKNYILQITSSRIDEYRISHKRKLKKAEKVGCIIKSISPSTFLKFFMKNNPNYKKDIVPHLRQFVYLIEHMFSIDKGKALGTFIEDKLTAVVFWGVDHDKLYYLFPAINRKGRDTGSNIFLIHNSPEYFKDITSIDFEGSEVKGVEHFILGFDAQLYPYPTVNW